MDKDISRTDPETKIPTYVLLALYKVWEKSFQQDEDLVVPQVLQVLFRQ